MNYGKLPWLSSVVFVLDHETWVLQVSTLGSGTEVLNFDLGQIDLMQQLLQLANDSIDRPVHLEDNKLFLQDSGTILTNLKFVEDHSILDQFRLY